MTETMYDVAILGSGPGGYVAAIRAGQLGLKTIVVEKDDRLGGTCLHVGCIPSKALLYTAELLDKLNSAAELGILIENVRLDWEAMQTRKTKIVRKLAQGITQLFRKNHVESLQGFGRLAGAGKLSVQTAGGKQALHAKNIVLATGSAPRSLPGVEIDGRTVLTNDSILSLPARPQSLAVIGAGAVGVEFASMFRSFGTKVMILEMLPRLLPLEDEEISAALEKAFRKRGIETRTSTRVESVETTSEGARLTFRGEQGESETRTFEKLLVAVGRKPRTDDIGLETVEIRTDKGFISVDGFMRTSAPGVYAIGDIVPSQQLAHVGSAEGILVVESIAGRDVAPMNYDRMPSCTYCSPEVASVGLSEANAAERGYRVRVGRFPFGASSKAAILGETEGFVKVVSEKQYDELLGVHIIGPHATDLIAEAVVALEHEATAESLMRAVHAHPTLSESVMEAAHGAVEKPIHV